jgi:tetratricopeptide (TPR) repeat protein
LALQLSIIKAARADVLGLEWQASIEKARELCTQTGGSAALAQVLGEQSIVYYVRAQYPKALELGEEALALAETADDPMPVALGHWRLGFIHFARGEFLVSREHLGHVLAFYKPEIHHQSFLLLHGSDAGASAMSYEACCLWMLLGYPDQALRSAGRRWPLHGTPPCLSR